MEVFVVEVQTPPAVLVVGCKPGSLGEAVKEVAEGVGYTVITAGVSGEQLPLDISNGHQVAEMFRPPKDMTGLKPVEHVVCTAGINYLDGIRTGDLHRNMVEHMAINAVGPLDVLSRWHRAHRAHMKHLQQTDPDVTLEQPHFVAISSNSAHIARSTSIAYCASKAALSMGIRCAARDSAKDGWPMVIYGYEPGWINGTPMSNRVTARFGGPVHPPLHRIPHGDGIDRYAIARTIVSNLYHAGMELNGTLIRLDGGEQ